jgi:hypothetical protein
MYGIKSILRIVFGWVPILMAGCGDHSFTLVYVIPSNFRGIVKMEGGRPDADRWAEFRGNVILVVPRSGTLRFSNKELPIRKWHRTEARFSDGKPILILEDAGAIPDQVAIRGAEEMPGPKGEDGNWFVVGTFDEWKTGMKAMHGFSIPDHRHPESLP